MNVAGTASTLALLAWSVAGCGNYALGPGGELPYDSIHVRAVRNDSLAPQAGTLLARALREEILGEGRVRLASSPEEADAVLDLRLVDYARSPETYRSDDTALASGFRLRLKAEATLRATSGGRTYFRNRSFVSGFSVARPTLTRVPEDRQPLMAACRSLARDVATTVSRPW